MKTPATIAVLVCSIAWASPGRAQTPAAEETQQSRQDYKTKIRKDLDELGRKIVALEVRARTEEDDARESLQATIDSLRARKDETERMLNKFDTASEKERARLRIKIDRQIREIRNAYAKTTAYKKTAQ